MPSNSRCPPRGVWSLLLTVVLPCMTAALSFSPETVEVDLVFPRNDTYGPAPFMPILFAIQNAHLAASLSLGFNWQLEQIDDVHDDGPSSQDILALYNTTNATVYYAYQYTFVTRNTEAQWRLVWSLESSNCSADGSSYSGASRSRFVIFSTSKSAPAPDLVTATADKNCTDTDSSFTFNVTGTTDVQIEQLQPCAILAPGPSPPPTPCGAAVNAAAASSISAAITATACRVLHPDPSLNCPTESSRASRVVSPATGWKITISGWLAFFIGAIFGPVLFLAILR